MPIIAHTELLRYLARKTTNTSKIEQLIVKHPNYFSNFNARFYDGLCVSINSVQFLAEIDAIEFSRGRITVSEQIGYEHSMGIRAKWIFDASKNIATLMNDDAINLYTNLRVQV